MESVKERFLRYIAIDTQSAESEKVPSTEKQRDLAVLLYNELKEIGASNVRYDEEHAYVYATIPATVKTDAPVLGFISHMDTAPAFSGTNIKPRIIENYDGGDICLNGELGIVLSPKDFPTLNDYIGTELIVTDGTTLLGADDKAGIAEIMTMAAYLLENPQIPHQTIQIGFTPDEEVGRGVDFFDVKGFGADFAYTMDGGKVGEIDSENFNAARAKVHIKGKGTHSGNAKNVMINAALVGIELNNMLPEEMKPAYTQGYEGFYHLEQFEGNVDSAEMKYNIREFDKEKFANMKQLFKDACTYLNHKYGEGTVSVEMKDQFLNMREPLLPYIGLLDDVRNAMKKLGITPIENPSRGGTDGCRLSYMGLPCPNLGTGCRNAHGRYEYISTWSLDIATKLLIELVTL